MMTDQEKPIASRVDFFVAIPAYNEASTVGELLENLLADPRIPRIVVSDDLSTDGTEEIVRRISERDSRVVLLRGEKRAGQVAGWLACAKACESETIVFIDADATPDPSAVLKLARACAGNLIVSGRVEPYDGPGSRAGGFSAALLDCIRRDCQALAIIGRFFAVNRSWFVSVCDRTDIIANDMWLACLAAISGNSPKYVPEAVVRYVAPADGPDFAAQRQRADAGEIQLRDLGLLRAEYLPSMGSKLRALTLSVLAQPANFPSWLGSQIVARIKRYYTVPRGAHVGIWEPQASTKKRHQ